MVGCICHTILTTGSTMTAAPVDSAAPNLSEAQPQVNPNVRPDYRREGTE